MSEQVVRNLSKICYFLGASFKPSRARKKGLRPSHPFQKALISLRRVCTHFFHDPELLARLSITEPVPAP